MTPNEQKESYLKIVKYIGKILKLSTTYSDSYDLTYDRILPIRSGTNNNSEFIKLVRSLVLIKQHKKNFLNKSILLPKHFYDLGPLVLVYDLRETKLRDNWFDKYFYYLITKEEWEMRLKE